MATFGALDLKYCEHLKEEGNALLQSGQSHKAVEEYTKALEHAKKTLQEDEQFKALALASS